MSVEDEEEDDEDVGVRIVVFHNFYFSFLLNICKHNFEYAKI